MLPKNIQPGTLGQKVKKMEESKMSEEFHDWLDKCPVQWHRDKADDDSATYTFIKNDNSD